MLEGKKCPICLVEGGQLFSSQAPYPYLFLGWHNKERECQETTHTPHFWKVRDRQGAPIDVKTWLHWTGTTICRLLPLVPLFFTKIPGFMRFSETKVARQAKNRGVPSLRKVMDEFLNSVKFLACWVPNLARIWVSLLSLPLLTSLLSSHRAVRSRIFLRTTVLPQSPLVSFLSFSDWVAMKDLGDLHFFLGIEAKRTLL